MACTPCEERRRAIKIIAAQLKSGYVHPILLVISGAWAAGLLTAAILFIMLGG